MAAAGKYLKSNNATLRIELRFARGDAPEMNPRRLKHRPPLPAPAPAAAPAPVAEDNPVHAAAADIAPNLYHRYQTVATSPHVVAAGEYLKSNNAALWGFILSWLGLIPFVGAGPALVGLGLSIWGRVKVVRARALGRRAPWRRLAVAGIVISSAGLLGHLFLGALWLVGMAVFAGLS